MLDAFVEPAAAFALCLGATFVTAPIALFVAGRMEGAVRSAYGRDIVWKTALFAAAAPAPLAAAWAALKPLIAALSAPSMGEPMLAAIAAEPGFVSAPPPVAPESAPWLAETLFLWSAIYLAGVAVLAMRSGVRAVVFSRRLRAAPDMTHTGLLSEVGRWRGILDIRRPVAVKRLFGLASVCLAGWRKPKIVVPDGLVERAGAQPVSLMCAHELAHLRRADPLFFAASRALSALYWFNPAFTRLEARAAAAAEAAADAMVVAGGADRRAYAQCYLAGLKYAADASERALIGATSFCDHENNGGRRMRMKSILETPAGRPSALLRVLAALGGGLALCLAGGQAVLAAAATEGVKLPDNAPFHSLPVDGRVTLAFGAVIKGMTPEQGHRGLDIAAPQGSPVTAPASGRVLAATDQYKDQSGWGNVVVIDHGGGWVTRYAHLGGFSVHKGERVTAGEEIGRVGSTGVSTGPHVHYEVLKDGAPVDPEEVTFPAAPHAPTPTPVTPASAPAQLAPSPAPAVKPVTPKLETLPAPVAPKASQIRATVAVPVVPDVPKIHVKTMAPKNGEKVLWKDGDGTVFILPPDAPGNGPEVRFDGKDSHGSRSITVRRISEDGNAVTFIVKRGDDGEKRFVFNGADGTVRQWSELSAKERKAVEADMKAAEKARKQAEQQREHIRAKHDAARDQRAIERTIRREAARGERQDEMAQERAQARAEALQEAFEARAEAERDAAQARAEARREAEDARREAETERRQALAEARQDMSEQADDLRRQAKDLAKAREDLDRQRAQLEQQAEALRRQADEMERRAAQADDGEND